MWTCAICRFETECDDVVVALAHARCICLRCYARETGGGRALPKALRRELESLLALAESA